MTTKALAHATTVTAIATRTLGLSPPEADLDGVLIRSGYAAAPTPHRPKSVMAFLR
jgi:hypothetical protein